MNRARGRRLLFLALIPLLMVSTKASVGARLNRSDSGHGHAHHPQYAQDSGALAATMRDRQKIAQLAPYLDGAKNPELIPDSVAYGHFIRATASATTPADVSRRKVFLDRAGLSVPEQTVYVNALGTAGEALEEVKRQRRAKGPMTPGAVQKLEMEAVSNAEARIRAALPPTARAKLDAHINSYIKRRIKMYRGNMQ
jgi:hypothetical protein